MTATAIATRPAASGTKRPLSFLENTFTHRGTVLAVRAWEPAAFYEIDLHLPEARGIERWQTAKCIKVRVGPYAFRDYTPAGWDAATHTCTLYIDAAHTGAGSRWAAALQPGDTLHYLNIEGAHQSLDAGMQAVFLGDQSAIGHFLALAQLAGSAAAISGAVVVPDPAQHHLFRACTAPLALEPLPFRYDLPDSIAAWTTTQSFAPEAVFYLAGNAHLVAALRRLLKGRGVAAKCIKAQGFWH